LKMTKTISQALKFSLKIKKLLSLFPETHRTDN
jgi:hypothetical protein